MIRLFQILTLSMCLIGLCGPAPGYGQQFLPPQGASGPPSSYSQEEGTESGRRGRDRSIQVPGTDLPSAASLPSSSSPSSSAFGSSVTTRNAPSLPGDPTQAPIGGLGWLVAAGVGYGTYRLRDGGEAS